MASRFASRREQRLWCWAAVVVAAIYATLGAAARLAGRVDEAVLGAAFVACLILVGVAVVTQGLRVRPRGVEIGIVVGIGAVYVLLGVRLALPERSHLIEYSVVAVLVYEALRERARHERRVPVPFLTAVALTALVGVIDEAIQLFLPTRVFDPVDILFNCLASVTAVGALALLERVRRDG